MQTEARIIIMVHRRVATVNFSFTDIGEFRSRYLANIIFYLKDLLKLVVSLSETLRVATLEGFCDPSQPERGELTRGRVSAR